jgi:hypothetical protein
VRRHTLVLFAVVLAAVFASTLALPSAQTQAENGGKKVLTPDDYTRWRTIGDEQISPDGKWVSYVLRFANTAPADAKPVLHLKNLETGQEVEVPHGARPRMLQSR